MSAYAIEAGETAQPHYLDRFSALNQHQVEPGSVQLPTGTDYRSLCFEAARSNVTEALDHFVPKSLGVSFAHLAVAEAYGTSAMLRSLDGNSSNPAAVGRMRSFARGGVENYLGDEIAGAELDGNDARMRNGIALLKAFRTGYRGWLKRQEL